MCACASTYFNGAGSFYAPSQTNGWKGRGRGERADKECKGVNTGIRCHQNYRTLCLRPEVSPNRKSLHLCHSRRAQYMGQGVSCANCGVPILHYSSEDHAGRPSCRRSQSKYHRFVPTSCFGISWSTLKIFKRQKVREKEHQTTFLPEPRARLHQLVDPATYTRQYSHSI